MATKMTNLYVGRTHTQNHQNPPYIDCDKTGIPDSFNIIYSEEHKECHSSLFYVHIQKGVIRLLPLAPRNVRNM